jgi:hypothetical protein
MDKWSFALNQHYIVHIRATTRINLNADLFFGWRGIQPDYWIDFTSQDIVDEIDPQMNKALELVRRSKEPD